MAADEAQAAPGKMAQEQAAQVRAADLEALLEIGAGEDQNRKPGLQNLSLQKQNHIDSLFLEFKVFFRKKYTSTEIP